MANPSERLQNVDGIIFIVVQYAGPMLDEELAEVLTIDDRLIDTQLQSVKERGNRLAVR